MALRRARFPLILLVDSVFSLLSAILAAGQCNCSIQLGSELSAGGNSPSWLSPSGEFAFGFRPLQFPASNKGDLFLLAIWFNKIPEQTIVWSINDHLVPGGSTIQLTKQGQFNLYDSQAKKIVWSAEVETNQATNHAAMLDSGNFVLIDGDSRHIWESFGHPTDTILPGQKLSRGLNLASRQNESATNYADRRFQLRMGTDGNLMLYDISVTIQEISYWESGTIATSSSSQLIFDEDDAYIYIQQGNVNIRNITKGNMGSKLQDFYYMARMDFDGVFRLYNHSRGNYADGGGSSSSGWTSIETIPENICTMRGNTGPGVCGYNSYCENSDNGRPTCHCPEGYSLLDPLDQSRGCKPNFQFPSCQQNGWESSVADIFEFTELSNTNWPLADYELRLGLDKDTCKRDCLRDCFCAAVIHNIKNQCWKKRFPLSNGIRTGNSNTTTALIKVARKNATPKCKDKSTTVIVMSALLGSSVFLNFLLLIAISVAVFFVYHKKLLNFQAASTVNMLRKYTYKELEEATRGFKQQLGRGAFGTVYKGVLPSIPGRYIAIKRLDKVEKQGEKEFTTEVSAIGQTHHKNLVKLLGYCDEGNHRLLVYEHMSNGSLESHLFGLSRPHWNERTKIAFGIARGLTYLHEECSSQIIHCDVKPQNILLDEYLTPKISDFGMAKLLLSEQSRAARTNIRGTIGYFAPEWFRKAAITVKVDVYSFGVMLLEIICCMSSLEFGLEDEEEALVDWAYDCYRERNLNKLVENDEEARNDMKSVERLVMVAIWCIQEDPSLRPSMRRVTQMLEGVAEVSVPPRPSFFSSLEIGDTV